MQYQVHEEEFPSLGQQFITGACLEGPPKTPKKKVINLDQFESTGERIIWIVSPYVLLVKVD